VLEEGGRVLAKTSLGQRPLQIDPKEAGRRLVRRPGEGLPARGPHKAGDLFLRLEQEEGQPVREGSARALLRRFAATWAA
jgi:curved DNA-binding protein